MTTVPTASRRRKSPASRGRLLTYDEAAERLGTTRRFPRRLVAERRIDFVKDGRFVRIPEEALSAYVATHLVEAAE